MFDQRSLVERAGSGDKGTLLLIAVHPENGALAYLVVHHLLPGRDTLLHEQYVTTIAPGHVTVTLPDATLNALPPYRSDDELQQEVERILFDLTQLHIDLKGITMRVLDSVLYLGGKGNELISDWERSLLFLKLFLDQQRVNKVLPATW